MLLIAVWWPETSLAAASKPLISPIETSSIPVPATPLIGVAPVQPSRISSLPVTSLQVPVRILLRAPDSAPGIDLGKLASQLLGVGFGLGLGLGLGYYLWYGLGVGYYLWYRQFLDQRLSFPPPSELPEPDSPPPESEFEKSLNGLSLALDAPSPSPAMAGAPPIHAEPSVPPQPPASRESLGSPQPLSSPQESPLGLANDLLSSRLHPALTNMVHHLPGIIFVRQAGAEAVLLFLSDGCLALTGYAAADLLQRPDLTYNSLIHVEDRLHVLETVAIAFEQQQPYDVEYRIQTRQGDIRWVSEQGQLSQAPQYQDHFVGLILDITSIRQTEERLRLNAFHDQLTGLPNRALFMDRLRQAFHRSHRHPQHRFAVLFLDLDRFKIVNDSLGHLIGDQLLKQVAQRLQICLRPTDTIARLGGDEFTILVEDVGTPEDIKIVGDRILQALSTPYELGGQEVYSSASLGIALSQPDYKTPEDLLRDADIALYQAKGLGKARYTIFEPLMRTPAMNVLRLETEMRKALDRGEFELYYQPIVFLETGSIVGFEALLRWVHPQRGVILPHEFIPIAEETGLQLALDEWVLFHACHQLNHWAKAFPAFASLAVSVNLSNRKLVEPNAVGQIQRVLDHTGLGGDRLQLEINEAALLHNTDTVALTLRNLQNLGVQIGLDDFGTGYSSLSYLHQFPVNRLKVDRAFIQSVHTQKNLAIVQTIIELAHHLDMDVVAEGVETGAQVAQIRAFGCEYGQGYWFAHPLTIPGVEGLLHRGLNYQPEDSSPEETVIPQLKINSPSGVAYVPLLDKSAWKIGRSKDSNILIADRWVSQDHAILQTVGTDDIYLVDLASRNGSYVNGQRIESPVLLQFGDRLRVGQTPMEFQAMSRDLPSPEDASLSSLDVTDGSPLPQPLKTVLMFQPNRIQGEIWREALRSQGVSVIWPESVSTPSGHDPLTLADRSIKPDLLLLDLQITGIEPLTIAQDYQRRYPQLVVVFSDSLRSHIDPQQRVWALHRGAVDVFPRWNLDQPDNSLISMVEDRVSTVLQYLQAHPLNSAALSHAIEVFQQILGRQTYPS